MATDYQTDQLKEKIEVLDGSRGRDRSGAAIRVRDIQAILNYAPKLKSAKAAGATPTKAEHDALVTDLAANSSILTAGGRYVAVIAAVLQVTAPDFGLGLFHGRERQTLWTGGMLGLLIAILAIAVQDSSVLGVE